MKRCKNIEKFAYKIKHFNRAKIVCLIDWALVTCCASRPGENRARDELVEFLEKHSILYKYQFGLEKIIQLSKLHSKFRRVVLTL
jgi:hypothetical protein